MMDELPELVVIVGPTASGKTEAAIRLAAVINGAVVSADSRQIYTGMDIGTAKAKMDHGGDEQPHAIEVPDKIKGIDHYLINIRRPDEEMSLAEWQAAAYQAIDAIVEESKKPIVAGGTMLYVDSIVFAYNIPAVPRNKNLRAELATLPVEVLYEKLIKLDPNAAQFVPPLNTRRIIRALEVIEATGRPFSAQRQKDDARYRVKMYGLFPGWDQLKKNIAQRAQQMLEEGLAQEKERLIKEFGASLPLLRTLNYDQVPNQEEMVRRNIKYARRQMSWWRGRKEIEWHENSNKLLGIYTNRNYKDSNV